MTTQSLELSVSEAAGLLRCDGSTVRRKCLSHDLLGARHEKIDGAWHWRIPLGALGLPAARELDILRERGLLPASGAEMRDPVDSQVEALDNLEAWQREAVATRKTIIDRFTGKHNGQWTAILDSVRTEYPELRISRSTVYRWASEYQSKGLVGLAPGYGRSRGTSLVSDDFAEMFDSLALKEGEPSLTVCYRIVNGLLKTRNPDTQLPSLATVIRNFNKRHPRSYRDFRRKGYAYWQRTYEYYIERTVDGIKAGKGWFSDHHQLDTLVIPEGGKDPVRPWVTVWRDVRSGKILSAHIHVDPPNSDDIFYAFYLAAVRFGLPDWIYIDNGKDYRVSDFTGQTRRFVSDKERFRRESRSLMGIYDIDVVFALPYNAQAKSVERDFRTLVSEFSKTVDGYAGPLGKRPQATKDACKSGALMSFRECAALLSSYINDCFNCRKNNGKLCQGLSPDEVFAANRGDIRTASAASLKLCLMRTSKPHKIGRNGIVDTELGATVRYWAEWMYPLKGETVYMRRNIEDYAECWVWLDGNDQFLGRAVMAEAVSLRAEGPIPKQALETEIRRKREDKKRALAATRPRVRVEGHEAIAGLIAEARPNKLAAEALASMGTPSLTYHITPMDHAVAEEELARKTGTYDLADAVPPEPEPAPEIYLYEWDKEHCGNG